MQFLSNKHKNRFIELLTDDGTHNKDVERRSLFYIISGSNDLYDKRKHIYDFNNNWINSECLDSENVDFSTSSKALIRLGIIFIMATQMIICHLEIFYIALIRKIIIWH